jgi:D-proline reductase (dithiol) PrdB
MPRLETLSEVQRRTLEFFPCLEHDDTPWVSPAKPLSQCKVALVTSAGLHLRGDQPFTRDTPGGESTCRVIPSNCDPSEVVQSHFSIGFDHTGIYRDINVTFPVDRLRELEKTGEIGSLSNDFYSFMGALKDASTVINETGPEVARLLKGEGVDIVLLTPT